VDREVCADGAAAIGVGRVSCASVAAADATLVDSPCLVRCTDDGPGLKWRNVVTRVIRCANRAEF
jgi:hypothetical protein